MFPGPHGYSTTMNLLSPVIGWVSHPFKKKKTIAIDLFHCSFVAATLQCSKTGVVLNQELELRVIITWAFTEVISIEREINANTSLFK